MIRRQQTVKVPKQRETKLGCSEGLQWSGKDYGLNMAMV